MSSGPTLQGWRSSFLAKLTKRMHLLIGLTSAPKPPGACQGGLPGEGHLSNAAVATGHRWIRLGRWPSGGDELPDESEVASGTVTALEAYRAA